MTASPPGESLCRVRICACGAGLPWPPRSCSQLYLIVYSCPLSKENPCECAGLRWCLKPQHLLPPPLSAPRCSSMESKARAQPHGMLRARSAAPRCSVTHRPVLQLPCSLAWRHRGPGITAVAWTRLPEGVGVLGWSSHEPHQRAGRQLWQRGVWGMLFSCSV